MPNLSKEVFVTIGQAQVLAGVSRRTIYNWLEAGKLTLYRNPGGAVRIVQNELIPRRERAHV